MKNYMARYVMGYLSTAGATGYRGRCRVCMAQAAVFKRQNESDTQYKNNHLYFPPYVPCIIFKSPTLIHHAMYTKSYISFRSDAFRCVLTPSSVCLMSLSILRNTSNEYQRLLIVRCKIALFKHRRTTASVTEVPAVMWMSGETATS
jgi:hypothetical protein